MQPKTQYALVVAAVIGAAAAALVLLRSGHAEANGRPDAPKSTFSVAQAKAFGDFPLYDAGHSVEGLPLVAELPRWDELRPVHLRRLRRPRRLRLRAARRDPALAGVPAQPVAVRSAGRRVRRPRLVFQLGMFGRVHARSARRAQVPTTSRLSTLTRARSPSSERSEPEGSTHPTRVDFDFAQVPVTSPVPLAGDQPEEQEGMMLGGDATSASTSDLSAAAWTDHGVFKWWIKWVTDGMSGWIVQKINNTYSGTDGAGKAITNATVG